MEVNTIKDAFDRVEKKQKITYSKMQETIDQVMVEIEGALGKLQLEHQFGSKPVLSELQTKLKEAAPLAQMEGTQKDTNIAANKYVKLLEKSFNPNISKSYWNIDLDNPTMNQIIATHFYRQGLFDVGDCFVDESNAMSTESAAAMKSPYMEMYQIVKAITNKNLGPALNWAAANSSKLKENGSDLELELHRMQFLELLQKGCRNDAFKYARTHLSPFAPGHLAEIQKLMGCLLFSGRVARSPYSEFLSPTKWEKLADEVTRQFCNLLGQSSDSPLSVTISAGFQALPPLLKFMTLMAGKKQELQTMKQLPIPLELDDYFQFHSVFVCPVSKEQATEENPPMLMSCGHVLCKQPIVRMSKNLAKSFKCPYCPTDIDASLCRQLNL